MTEFQFYLSSEINLNVRLRISHLEGSLKLPSVEDDPELRHTSFYNSLCRNLFITCSICANGKQLTIPVRTSFSDTNLRWTEWLVFPIKYQGLPLNSQVVITVWNVFAPRKKIPVGGTAFNLFTDSRRLRKGRQKLYLWPNREGDASAHSSTPGKSKERNEIDRLEHIVKKYDLNQVTRIDWLDKATFTEIEKLRKMSVESSNEKLYLNVELPTFEYPVVFNEREFEVPPTLPPNAVVVTIYDPEMQRKEANPIANKHLRLVSDVWKKLVDPNLRPNPEERDRIEKILAYPITKVLSVEDKDILWKYRFFLTSNKKALTKFLRCVDWSSSEETKQAADLINQWEHVEITDALELLSKSFLSSIVRDYAVATLEQASSEELSHYLLQLVQALRYDSQSSESRLASFLVKRSVQEKKLLNDLYWYLRVECEDPKYETFYKEQLNNFMRELSKTEEGKKCILDLKRQEDMIGWMNGIYKELKSMGKQPKKKKVAKFQELISPGNTFSNLGKFPFKIPIPVDPLNDASGVLIEKVNVFTSAMEPLGVPFLTQGKTYTVIFKSGDDLRQDQVIIQLISLMDNLLKKESLDLKLSPYAVLSTSTKDGMVQAVPDSKTITAILNEYGNDIHNYLRQGSNQIEPEVLNTFVRSCGLENSLMLIMKLAGYCVITYLLCVGDRHLDNLLITKDGHLFHIDFGFIGRDPKPYPPPMKLCPEMVAAMGGEFDVSFKQFKSYCISAFNILRKNANLILNLMSLMLDSNISDLANERTLLQIQDKFLLDKNDEEASHYFQQLMAESVTALFPRIAEKIHKWKQYWDNR